MKTIHYKGRPIVIETDEVGRTRFFVWDGQKISEKPYEEIFINMDYDTEIPGEYIFTDEYTDIINRLNKLDYS